MKQLSHVFVSSTYLDLESYRAAVTRAILDAGHMPGDMIYWPASEEPPLDTCLSRVRTSDLLILLLAHRYGFVPSGGDQSVTEAEFTEAEARGIPILAFLIDSEYPWPPKWIDRDSHQVEQLARFRDRVNRTVTTRLFTTPESLETAVTHALASFLNRKDRASDRKPMSLPSVVAQGPEVLKYAPDACVRIGLAPDGAPLLLRVKRSTSLTSALSTVQTAIGASSRDASFVRTSDDLKHQAKAHAILQRVHTCSVGGTTKECFVTTATMSELFAPSLLESMIGGNALMHEEPGYETRRNTARHKPEYGTPTTTGAGLLRPGKNDGVDSLGGLNRFLFLPLDDQSKPWSGGFEDCNGQQVARIWRPFEEESIERFRDATYQLTRVDPKTSEAQTLYRGSEAQTYLSAWLDMLTELDLTTVRSVTSRVTIPRKSLLEFLLSVTVEIAELHKRNEIHADIKPSNILASRSGHGVIDAVHLTLGDVSPVVTPGWSPPEQLTRQPLGYSADVYTLSLLFLRALGGERLGMVVKYRMPQGMEAAVVVDPAVYFKSEAGVLSDRGRTLWASVLQTGLRADPGARYADATVFCEAVSDAVAAEPPRGNLALKFPWGDTPTMTTSAAGTREVAWVVDAYRE